jgi:hypothetical protein
LVLFLGAQTGSSIFLPRWKSKARMVWNISANQRVSTRVRLPMPIIAMMNIAFLPWARL